MSKLRHALVALSLPALLWGCGPEDLPSGTANPAAPGTPLLATQEEELAATGEYTWAQGEALTPLGASAGRACFLTRVGGDFEGSGERIDITESGGSWYLGGASNQSGIRGAARCVDATASQQYEWTQSMAYPVSMGTAAGRVCFLTGVAGKFHGSGEWVRAYVENGYWYLNGNSSQSGVRARARCVATTSYTDEFGWGQGGAAKLMDPVAGRACALTYMRGKFEGGGEYVRTFQSNGYWYLGGASGQVEVSGRARCF
ncbi:hypothetical protein HI113_00440 [Corallococcus exiguus]|uniref:hypothetical protein n=1 Tax=Corallococcus TaxID=83461 RepID=UPI0011C39C5D|nr:MULTISPECIES: hypothetical protein [Corallococcus]NNB84031.1 hypothetical protein [Corallococcus exiguus]NNB92390.1 hypothetical protein [Corallococcus exiguus]NPC46245.1 hypothetical protein [Corallococcus exiguus]